MSWDAVLNFWSDSAVVSMLIWVLITVVGLYLARHPAHEMFRALGFLLHRALRLASCSVMRAEQRAVSRNREVLLSMAQENQQRFIGREFHRVHAVVARDLSGYPSLHRALSDQITRIDEDYRKSTDVPPMPPSWLGAVEAVAKIPAGESPVVGRILEDIHGTLRKASEDAVEEYRAASQKRHMYLKRMMPYWRKLTNTLDDVGKTIDGIEERSQVIDTQMERFEEIRAKTDRMVNTLASSASKQFFIDSLILLIAVLGGVVNFWLIQRPMSEVVGAAAGITVMSLHFTISHVAAFVVIALEITLGVFLMESLRITRLFPVIGALDDKMRHRMIWITFALLFTLASIEAGLAYMRDLLALQDQAFQEDIRSQIRDQVEIIAQPSAEQPASFRWIPSVALMILGFILPFILALVAIPLESFAHSARIVLGSLHASALRVLAFALRLGGNISRSLSFALVRVYDLLIFLPLTVERVVHRRGWSLSSEDETGEVNTALASPTPQPSIAAPKRRQKKDNAEEV